MIGHGLGQVTGYRLQRTGYRLRAAGYGLRRTDYGIQALGYGCGIGPDGAACDVAGRALFNLSNRLVAGRHPGARRARRLTVGVSSRSCYTRKERSKVQD